MDEKTAKWIGEVYSTQIITPNTGVLRWSNSEERLTKISIVNTAASFGSIGAYNSNVTTFRANAFILAQNWSIHLYDVDLYTLGYASTFDLSPASLKAIGVKE